jgi:hypothetical protein
MAKAEAERNYRDLICQRATYESIASDPSLQVGNISRNGKSELFRKPASIAAQNVTRFHGIIGCIRWRVRCVVLYLRRFLSFPPRLARSLKRLLLNVRKEHGRCILPIARQAGLAPTRPLPLLEIPAPSPVAEPMAMETSAAFMSAVVSGSAARINNRPPPSALKAASAASPLALRHSQTKDHAGGGDGVPRHPIEAISSRRSVAALSAPARISC